MTTAARTRQNNMFNERKQCLCTCFYCLVHFLAVSCKTTTSNYQIVGFVDNVNIRRSIFLSVFELVSRHYKFSSWAIQSHQTNSTNWSNCKVVSKSSIYCFPKTFSLPLQKIKIVVVVVVVVVRGRRGC